ncbi:YALI0C16599p [Yarrowia lipolytica CLIB122]|uniref:YALI0C16599p n=1 Tax=Yarrowia lipolytica (strain CLIB 122 / E 150) TaxID=284591 RepID=Q6CBQ2_YARLI|nr:YALI0C16599p [Yarrowia lipolytica CLIB122]CAG82230.1 YALI0C16599p [Yarrowia lipolytica CLIB122]|eukprot:XP_501910.1 YALI0C16599p [Yarrowia lipolytica CLIB122]
MRVCWFSCWRSSKEKSIALSTAEAEYMALSEGTKTVMWLTEVYEDFGIATLHESQSY